MTRFAVFAVVVALIALTASTVSARWLVLWSDSDVPSTKLTDVLTQLGQVGWGVDEEQHESDIVLEERTQHTQFPQLGEDVETLTTTHTSERGNVTYALGSRVKGKHKLCNQTLEYRYHISHAFHIRIGFILGDTLVSQLVKRLKWTNNRNPTITVSYPKRGQGAEITYVHINVNQVRYTIRTLRLLSF